MPHRIETPSVSSLQPAQPSQPWPIVPVEVQEVQSAIDNGSFSDVTRAFSKWLDKDPANRCGINRFMCCISDAITNDRPEVLDYLLHHKVPFVSAHIKRAVRKESKHLLGLFLKYNWKINDLYDEKTPPLLSEATIQGEDLTKWFLENGADPNQECYRDCTPLSIAIQQASLRTIQLLFAHGGSIQHGQLLHHAALRKDQPTEVFELLFQKKAPGKNSRLHEHRPSHFQEDKSIGLGTPLHMAADVGNLDAVKCLLEAGADYSVQDSRGELAIDRARRNSHSDVVELLLAVSVP